MAQVLFKATGVTASNADTIKAAGMSVAAVKWVNVNGDNIVVTADDGFDEAAFVAAVQAADNSVNLSK